MNAQVAGQEKSIDELTVQETLDVMQQHFVTTGAYQPEHLMKILGNPAEAVAVSLPFEYARSAVKWW